MWGQVLAAWNTYKNDRIIPTRVGTSSYPQLRIPSVWDHPHACGDKLTLSDIAVICVGSSPRVWGQVVNWKYGWSTARIIPTRVGTSTDNSCIVRRYKDHPHACGDKSLLSEAMTDCVGSSPRVWGQVAKVPVQNRRLGIIPTRVGTRTIMKYEKIIYEDHPHACGDKQTSYCLSSLVLGSSPRVWGQGFSCASYCCASGIIPTRVGTSGSVPAYLTGDKDHPHACGDKLTSPSTLPIDPGSSPRVWGQGQRALFSAVR